MGMCGSSFLSRTFHGLSGSSGNRERGEFAREAAKSQRRTIAGWLGLNGVKSRRMV
jgi:hypothetical protein